MTSIKVLDRQCGIALWRQIAHDLASEIEEGHPGVGDKLPSELMLAEQYGVNRHTIRQAVNRLSNDGLVRIERGRGTFVQKRAMAFSLDTGRVHSQFLLMQDLEPDHELLGIGIMKADGKQALGLEVRPGDELVFVESLGKADGKGIVLSKSFFPLSRCPDMVEKIQRLKSIDAALNELGYTDTFNTMTRITAELPTNEVATKLDMPPVRPVLKVIKLNTSSNKQPLAFSLTYFSGDLCQLTLNNQ